MSFSLLRSILDSKRAFLVTVLATEGHTYKKPGAKALFEVGTDTPTYGNLGSQCVDRALIEWGEDSVTRDLSVRKSIDLTEDTDAVLGYGTYCGGKLEVLIEPIRPGDLETYAALMSALRTGRPVQLIRDLSNGSLLLEPCADSGDAEEALESSDSSQSLPIRSPDPNTVLEMWHVPTEITLFGATPLAHLLVPQLEALDFSVAVVDWRPTYLEKFDGLCRCLQIEREGIAAAFTDRSWVLILSHVFEQDRDALGAALAADVSFVGMLSSTSRRGKLFEELRERGVNDDQIARIHSPLGLDISSKSDPEIAVSIAAELIQARAKQTVHGASPRSK